MQNTIMVLIVQEMLFVLQIIGTILINAGNNLLHVDDFIQIYELGPEIKDCDGTILGNYEFIKDKLKVIETNICFKLRNSMLNFELHPVHILKLL